MKKVLLICGEKRHGKDYLAEMLCEYNKDCSKKAFADNIKKITQEIFSIDYETLDEYKNNPHKYYIKTTESISQNKSKVLSVTDYRQILQKLGTEAIKPIFGDDIWAKLVLEDIKKSDGKYFVISDFRFPEELKVFEDDDEVETLTVNIFDKTVINTDNHSNHSSETSLKDFQSDITVDNTGHRNIKEDVETIIKLWRD